MPAVSVLWAPCSRAMSFLWADNGVGLLPIWTAAGCAPADSVGGASTRKAEGGRVAMSLLLADAADFAARPAPDSKLLVVTLAAAPRHAASARALRGLCRQAHPTSQHSGCHGTASREGPHGLEADGGRQRCPGRHRIRHLPQRLRLLGRRL